MSSRFLVAIALLFTAAQGFVRFRPFRRTSFHSLNAEDGVSLFQLTDIETDALWLQSTICEWLDKEFIQQDIHQEIASRVKQVYAEERKRGVNDLGEMLMRLGSSLEDLSMREAFEGPWDIANKVSDCLMLRLDRELCDCADMSFLTPQTLATCIPTQSTIISSAAVYEASSKFIDSFTRYRFLKDFLDGEADWTLLHPLVAIILGFRAASEQGPLVQDAALAPDGWKYLPAFPDLSDTRDVLLATRLQEELPDDEKSTDLILEQLVGLEMLKIYKTRGNADTQRRLLVAKWLYVRGLFNDEFPHRELFIPGHMRELVDR